MLLKQVISQTNIRSPGRGDYGTTLNASESLEIDADFERRIVWLRNGTHVKFIAFENIIEATPLPASETRPDPVEAKAGEKGTRR